VVRSQARISGPVLDRNATGMTSLLPAATRLALVLSTALLISLEVLLTRV